MKKTLLFTIIIFFALVSNAQEEIIRTQSVKCEDGKMLHHYLSFDKERDQNSYELGNSPEGDYIGDIIYSTDGSKIFIPNSYSNNITILNADETLSDNISVGSYPLTLAVNNDYAVVPCAMSSDVYIIDLTDNSIAATIGVNGEPVTVKILGTKAYIGCDIGDLSSNLNDECAIIDLSTLTLENTITNFPVKLTSFTYTFNHGRTSYTYNNFEVSEDGAYLIAANWDDKINFYNTTTGAIDFQLDATDPKRVSKSGDGSTVVVISPENIYQVDIATHTIIETVNLSYTVPYPYRGIANQDGTKAFIALSGNQSAFVNFTTSVINTISDTQTPSWILTNSDHSKIVSGGYKFRVLDFETEAILGQFDGLSSNKGGIAPDLSKAIAYSITKFEGVFFYNLSNLNSVTLENYVPTGEAPEGDAPMKIEITPNGQKALIINELSHNISIFDITSRTFTSHIDLDGAPMDIEITSDGNYAVISTAYLQSEIVILDINTGTVVKEITAGSALQKIEISPDNSKAYIRDYHGSIFVINLAGASSSLETTISCGTSSYSSYGFGINPDIVLTPDGNYLFVGVISSHSMQIIDTKTNTIIKNLIIETSPYYIDFNTTGDKAIVCDLSANKYYLISVDGANSTVIEDFIVNGERPFRLKYNSIKDEMGITVYGNEVNDNGGQLLTVNPNTGEELSIVEYTSEGTGNTLQVLYDNEGSSIVLTEYKIIHGEEEYIFPERLKNMAYSPQENVALAISPVNDNLYVVDITLTNIENYAIKQSNFVVEQNSPNPARNFTVINYEVREKSDIKLSIYDNTGKLIKQINKGIQNKGNYSFEINVSDLKSGVYFYKFSSNKQSHTKKMIVE